MFLWDHVSMWSHVVPYLLVVSDCLSTSCSFAVLSAVSLSVVDRFTVNQSTCVMPVKHEKCCHLFTEMLQIDIYSDFRSLIFHAAQNQDAANFLTPRLKIEL